MIVKPVIGKRIQMWDDLYNNKDYEALKKTTNNRSTQRKSNTKKKKVPKTCCTAGN